jgi:hypothetical protein
MKICEFSLYDLRAMPIGMAELGLIKSALAVLNAALVSVNEAGLEGKRLSNLRVVHVSDRSRDPMGDFIEIHADVKHRLKTENARQETANITR